MKKQRLIKVFNLKELDLLIEDENSCVELQTLQEHLALHPFHLNDLSNSVKDILNSRIGKFCVRLDGILCGYKNIKFLSKLGHISDDSCFIHVDIEAEFFIFKPTKRKILEGIVHKKTKDHIGCLVHKIFNVSLPKPKKGEWIGESLTINSRIQLEISSTNFDGKLPYIKGKIVKVLDEGVSNDIEDETNVSIRKSSGKKGKKLIFDDETVENEELAVATTSPKKRKKEKRKATEDDDTEPPVKKKKKKSVEEDSS